MMTPVKFRKHSGRYNPGEVAGFHPPRAARLIASGVAEAYTAPERRAGTESEADAAARLLADAEARAAALDAREAELKAREAALEKPPAPAATSEAGMPPVQGGKPAAPGKK